MAPGNGKDVRAIMRRYYAVWWMYSFAGGFLFGVYPIFLRSRGLSQFEVNSVLAVFLFVLFLTDVPTGAFADALGRRRSFLVGCCLRTCAFIVYFTAHRYPVFIIAETIDGIGTTFCNGAIDAWGVDALDEAGYEGVKDRLFSRIAQLCSAGFMISAIIGAYVADIDIAWPWLLGAAGWALSAIVGAILMRDRRRGEAKVAFTEIAAQLSSRIVEGVRSGFRIHTVLMLSVAGAIEIAALSPYWMEWPVLFHETFAAGVWVIGWIYCVFTIARMIGAELAVRSATDEHGRVARVSLFVGATGVLLFVAGVFGSRATASLAVLIAMNVFAGAAQPLVQSWFNEQIESAQRATLLSFNGTFQTLGGSMGLLLAGYLADTAGIPFQWQVGALILLCSVPVFWSLRSSAASASVAISPADFRA